MDAIIGTNQGPQYLKLRKSQSTPDLTVRNSKLGRSTVMKMSTSDQKLNLDNSKTQFKSISSHEIRQKNPEKESSSEKIDLTGNTPSICSHDLIVHKITPEQFSDWDREKQSLGVRALFERASTTVFDSSNQSDLENLDKLFEDVDSRHVAILLFGDVKTGNGVSYKLISNHQEVVDILSNYNETLFKQTEDDQQMPYILDNTCSMTVSPEVIMRYTSSSGVARLPHIQTVLENSLWRNETELLTSNLSRNPENPDIVLRGVIRNEYEFISPGYFYCDAHNVVTQQLINFQRTRPSNPLNISFPDMEGRGGVFSIEGVPFHQYNSRSYNDFLCEYLGIFINKAEAFHKVLQVPTGIHVVELTPKEHHSMIPEIKFRQELPEQDYMQVLMTTLDKYIISSLEYQLTLPKASRIPYLTGEAKTEQASDTEIEHAITVIKSLLDGKPSSADFD